MLAQGGFKLQVEPLGYNNHPTWSRRMKDILLREGLWDTVEPAGAEVSTEKQNRALGWIRMHVDDSVRGDLDSEDLCTPNKVWKHLEQKHKAAAGVQKFQLREEWQGMRQQGGEGIAAYATRVKLKAAQVKAVGVAVDEQEEVMTLVRGLTEEFSMLRTMFRTQPQLASSVDAAVPPRVVREQEGKEQRGEEPAVLACRAQQQRGPPCGAGQQHGGRGAGRGSAGKRGRPGINGALKPVECWNCGQWGHFSDKCPLPARGGGRGAGESRGGGAAGRGRGGMAGRGGPAHSLAAVLPAAADEPMFGLVSTFEPGWVREPMMAGIGRSEHQQWVLDSGATHHCTADRSHFHQLSPVARALTTANGQQLPVLGIGTVWLRPKRGAQLVELRDVLWVPELTLNLISINRAMPAGAQVWGARNPALSRGQQPREGQHWCSMVLEMPTRAPVAWAAMEVIEGKSWSEHGLLLVEPEVVSQREPDGQEPELDLRRWEHQGNTVGHACPAKVQRPRVDLWHRRMGHLGFQNLRRLANMSTGMDVEQRELDAACRGEVGVCEECRETNITNPPFSSNSTPSSSAPLDLLHTDVCGPLREGRHGEHYFVTLLDDWSGASMVSAVRTRDQVPDRLKRMIASMQQMASKRDEQLRRVGVLHSDRGRELLSGNLEGWLERNGIEHQLSCPYTPQQNGAAERLNRTLVQRVRALLKESKMPGKNVWWPHALLHACYLRNRSPAAGKEATPLELLTGQGPPDLGHLRVWGTQCWVLLPRGHREDKLSPRGEPGRLVGCADSSTQSMSKGYKVWLSSRDEVVVSRAVAFDENVYWVEPTEGDDDLEEVERAQEQLQQHAASQQQQQQQPAPATATGPGAGAPGQNQAVEGAGTAGGASNAGEGADAASTGPRRSGRLAGMPAGACAMVAHTPEPNSFGEAVGGPEREQWREAMEDEVQSLRANRVFTLERAPPGQRVLPSKWVFKRKQGPEGVRWKARFVAKGFAQREGVDFFEVFAPVSTHSTLRMVLSLVAEQDLKLGQLNISTAFLNGELGEEVWVQPPEGFAEGVEQGLCWRLHKALYGLKQAPRAWYATLRAALEALGYTAAGGDPSLFTRVSDLGVVFLVVYVDDILVAANNTAAVQNAKREVLGRFKGRDLGEAGVYLGLEISRDRGAGTLTISQPAFTAQLLEKHGMGAAKGRGTPLDAGCKLSREGTPLQSGGGSNPYAELVGSLLYLSNTTRPDLAYATGALALFMAQPCEQHMQAAKAVLRYLTGSQSVGITYSRDGGELVGYGDADHGGCVDTRRSTTGFVFVRNGGAVCWCSKRQPVVALSTAEAEYIAAAALVREALWLQQLERDLQLGGNGGAAAQVQLLTDNQAALALLHGATGARRVKHVEVPYHFARQHVESGRVAFSYTPSEQMVADALTKPLGPSALARCKKAMGMI